MPPTLRISLPGSLKALTRNTLLWCVASLLIGISYFAITPPNAGPDEIVHARSSWYLSENPSKIFAKEFIVNSKIPSELLIKDDTHNFDHTACFTQRADIQPICQELSSGSFREKRFYIYYHSIPYYLLIGSAQHTFHPWLNAYESAKLTSFLLCWLLIILSLLALRKARPDSKLILFSMLLSPSCLFLFATVNPSSFEICAAILFVSTLISNSQARSYLPITFAGTLLAASRPLGFIWVCIFILYFRVAWEKFPIKIRFMTPMAAVFLTQVWLGYDWPSPLKYKNPDLEFYLEEAIREFNESGHWFAHFYGVLGAGEIKIPILFLYFNVVASLILVKVSASDNRKRKLRQYSVFSLGLFFVPALVQLVNSASWPVWWQGRYSLPVFVGLMLLHISQSRIPYLRVFLLLGSLTQIYLLVISFARFNWGLYPTSTPIIANGWSLSQRASIVFFTSFTLYLVLTLYLIGLRSLLARLKSEITFILR